MNLLTAGSARSIGVSVTRVEDSRILTGGGRYADDVVVAGMLHAAFVRSTAAHARVVSLDAAAARGADGVVAVFTGADVVARTSPISPSIVPPGFRFEPFYALASDRVRFVGDPLAIVVATSRALAEDAAELVTVEYEELDAIVSFADARDTTRTPLFESLGSNIVCHLSATGGGDITASFGAAHAVVRSAVVAHRVAPVPMEGRGGVAEIDHQSGRLLFHSTTQSPHGVRLSLAETLGVPLSEVDVVNGDIGGAFGLKISTHREELALCIAAHWLRRSVKWTEDRVEHLLAAGQAREESVDMETAVEADGRILGLRVHVSQNIGAVTLWISAR